MKYILINNIGEYPEDFLFAKVDIEKRLLEENKIEKRMKLEDFIIYLNIQNKIFMNNQKSIAFSIQNGLNDDYVFYSFLDNENTDSLFELFENRLKKMNYKFDNLRKLEPMELLEPDNLNGELFMINFEICKA